MDPNKDIFRGPGGIYLRLSPEQIAAIIFCIVCVALEQRDNDRRKVTPPEIQRHQYEHLGHYAPKAVVSKRPVDGCGPSAASAAITTGSPTANPAVNDFIPVAVPSSSRDGSFYMTRRPIRPLPLHRPLLRPRRRSRSRSASPPRQASDEQGASSSDSEESLD